MFKEYFWDVITKHYVDFDGRATRKQFWIFFVFCILIFTMMVYVTVTLHNTIPEFLTIALLMPYFAITVRRFRDTGVSTVWFAILKGLQVAGITVLSLPVISVFLSIITLGGFDPRAETFDDLFKIGGLIFWLSIAVELIICSLPSKKVLPREQLLSKEQALHSEQPNEQIK